MVGRFFVIIPAHHGHKYNHLNNINYGTTREQIQQEVDNSRRCKAGKTGEGLSSEFAQVFPHGC
jgi:hypothetical protein